VTDNPREFTNHNVEPVRGFLWSSIDGFVYGLNSHASHVMVFRNLDSTPEDMWQTLSLPTAIADWGAHVVVVGGGSHALAIHERTSGDIVGVVQVDSEPADVVIVGNDAFVSCMGDNTVVQVDLTTVTVVNRIEIPGERPRFLSVDDSGAETFVYVAPFLSGNNSSFRASLGIDPTQPALSVLAGIVDLSMLPDAQQLPDEDLFRFDAAAMGTTLTVAATGAGTLMTGHGRNPATGQHWMLNVDSRNQDATRNTEPLLEGQFAFNRLTIGQTTSLPFPTGTPMDIDLVPGTTTHSAANSLAFPFSVAFDPIFGFGLVSAMMSDRVAAFAPTGVRIPAFDVTLPDGSIPLHVEFNPLAPQYFGVHCWGSNRIEVCQAGVSSPILFFDLGLDPTPEIVQEGREIWYDAARSEDARFSCNTCHPGGRADGLAWTLSNPPFDHKDAMVTQSLMSIEDTFPYHWRGERGLRDFNGAFTGLLGAQADLNDAELVAFEAFIFSLQAHSNPNQDASRAVVTAPSSLGQPFGQPMGTGDAVSGAQIYQNRATFPGGNPSLSCNDCHQLPTGSNGDVHQIEPVPVTTQVHVEVAHFRELRHKDQDTLPNGRPRGGFGLTHTGEIQNLAAATEPFNLGLSEALDILAFMRQFDTGISPGAHTAFDLASPSPTSPTPAVVQALLHPQAGNGSLDVVAFGVALDSTQTPVRVRWLLDPATNTYTPSQPGFTPRTIGQLVPTAPSEWTVVLGLPPGNGRRFALDPDLDGLEDFNEAAQGTGPFEPDTDNDSFPDGYEVNNGSSPRASGSTPIDTTPPGWTVTPGGSPVLDFATTTLAKFTASTDEEAIVVATVTAPGIQPITHVSSHLARVHTIVVQGLTGTTNPVQHTASFDLIDRAGNRLPNPSVVTFTPPAIVTHPSRQGNIRESVRVTSVTNNPVTRTGNTATLSGTRFQLEVREPGSTPAPGLANHRVVATVWVRPAGGSQFLPATAASLSAPAASVRTASSSSIPAFFVSLFGASPAPYFILPATTTYLISPPTPASGVADLDFSLSGLSPGDEVVLSIHTIVKEIPSTVLTMDVLSLGSWSMPTTEPSNREIRFTF